MTTIPVLETQRLILRGFQPSDTEPFIAAMAQDDFARTITREARGLARDEAWRSMAMVNGSWSLDGFGNWVVTLKETGEPIGRLGPFAPPGWPDFEVGWAIFPEHQRKGYAVEGAVAAIEWCKQALGHERLIHCILKGNAGSERTAAALGSAPLRDWSPPWGGDVTIWETRWENFAQSRPYVALQEWRAGN